MTAGNRLQGPQNSDGSCIWNLLLPAHSRGTPSGGKFIRSKTVRIEAGNRSVAWLSAKQKKCPLQLAARKEKRAEMSVTSPRFSCFIHFQQPL